MKGLLWVFCEKFGLTAISFLATFWYAYLLGPEGYGLSASFLSISLFISGIQEDIQRNPLVATKQNLRDVSVISLKGWLSISIITSMVALAIMLLLAQGEFLGLAIISALHIPISVFSKVFLADLIRKQAYKSLAMRSVLGKAIGVATGLSLAFFGHAQLAIVTQSLLALVISVVVMWHQSKLLHFKELSFTFSKNEISEFKLLLKEGLPSGLHVINENIKGHGVIIILSMLSGSYSAGLFSLAMKFVDIPRIMIGHGFSTWALGKFRSVEEYNDMDIKDIFTVAFHISMVVLIPSYIGLAAVSDIYIVTIFGEEWEHAADLLNWMSIYYLLCSLFLYLPPLLIIRKRTYNLVSITLLSSIAMVLVLFALTPLVEYYSSVYGMFLSLLIVVYHQNRELKIITGISIWFCLRNIIGYFLSAVLMLIVVRYSLMLSMPYPLFSSVIIGVAVYLLSMFFMFIIRLPDLSVFKKMQI